MGEKIQLLLVDDEAEFVEYMSKRLRRHDFEVEAHTNPVEALEKTAGKNFDVGLLDLKMPQMDGEELLNRLKERDPSIEVIILTGHGSIESAFRSAQVGAYEYLIKPCDFDELVVSINSAFARRIKAQSGEKTRAVDDLMKGASGMSPLALLKRLKKLRDGVGESMAAAAMAEGGETEAARDFMKKKSKNDTP
jgi:two-component system NtrC family response regulator